MYRVFLFFVFLMGAVHVPLFAQPKPQKEDTDSDIIYRARIVISGENRRIVAQSVVKQEILDSTTIRELGAKNAAEALEFQSGLELEQELRGQSVRLQGLNPEHALILINGQRIIGALAGNLNLERIKSEEIDRIEITKGSSSALYGSNAIGGVINIITKKSKYPLSIVYSTTIGLVGDPFRFGERDFYQNGNENHHLFSVSTSDEKVKNSFTFGYHGSTILDLNGEYVNTNLPETRDFNFSHRLTGNAGKNWFLRSEINYRKLNQHQVDFSAPRTIFDRTNNTDDFAYLIGAKKYFGSLNKGEIDFHYYVARYHDELDLDQRFSDELDNQDFNEERLQSGNIVAKIPTLKNNTFTIGSEFQLEELISLRLDTGYASRENSALYLQDEFTFLVGSTRWYIVPGLRVEQDTYFGRTIDPKLALRWRFPSSLDIRFSVGRGFRRPTLRNLFLEFQNPGVGYQVIGNPDLLPERSLSYNLDFLYRPNQKSTLSFNLYHNNIENLIEFIRLQGIRNGFTTYQVSNLESVYTRGIEFTGEWEVSKNFRLRLAYNYNEAYNRIQRVFLEGRSLHRVIYGFSYFSYPHEFHWNGIFYSSQSVYDRGEVSGNPALVDFSDVIAGIERVVFRYPRHTINLKYTRSIGKLYQIYFGINNLLDQYDVDLQPVRPRYVYFGFKIAYDQKNDK